MNTNHKNTINYYWFKVVKIVHKSITWCDLYQDKIQIAVLSLGRKLKNGYLNE